MTNQFNSKSTADKVLMGVDLTGKRYLVTGVGSGIGRETARALAARGATVVGVVRDVSKADSGTRPIRDAAAQVGARLSCTPSTSPRCEVCAVARTRSLSTVAGSTRSSPTPA